MRIIREIVKGERNPRKLAELRDGRCKHTAAEIAKALEGNYRREHLFALRQAVELYDFYQQKIQDCDGQLQAQLNTFETRPPSEPLSPDSRKAQGNAPQFDLRGELHRMLGVDVTAMDGIDALTVVKVIGEIGTDMSRWPSAKHFTSWMGLCPGTKITGGRRLSGRVKRCANRAAAALRVAAQTLHRSKCALGEFLRQKKTLLGPAGAITATAHRMARALYAMLRSGQPYTETRNASEDARRRQRILKSLKRKAKNFGFELVPVAG